jgi:hypothetical protein
VVDLLELAQGIRVEVPLAREQVQLTQERRGLIRQQLAPDLGSLDVAPQTDTTSTTSGITSRSRPSMPIFSVAVEDGQPAHEPCMCR